VKEMERLEMDEEFLSAYNNEIVQKHMQEIERDEGYSEGFDNGKKETQVEMVKELIKRDMSVEDISAITKLSIDAVNKIIEDNK
jgi:predicted transposase/invertase (TIGR01784 family)